LYILSPSKIVVQPEMYDWQHVHPDVWQTWGKQRCCVISVMPCAMIQLHV
jgi:hypothetical protein